MEFDKADFVADCRRRKQMVVDLAALEKGLTARFPAARAAGMTIAEIMAESGGAQSWVQKYAPGTPKTSTEEGS